MYVDDYDIGGVQKEGEFFNLGVFYFYVLRYFEVV